MIHVPGSRHGGRADRGRKGARDPFGTAVALVLGALVGIALATPALPDSAALRVGDTSFGVVGTAMLAGALAVVLLPLGIVTLYRVFALVDR